MTVNRIIKSLANVFVYIDYIVSLLPYLCGIVGRRVCLALEDKGNLVAAVLQHIVLCKEKGFSLWWCKKHHSNSLEDLVDKKDESKR